MRYQLDARRLLCPLPVIRVQDKAKELLPGDILDVVCTDPGTLHDIPTWCRMHGHQILESRRENNQICFVLQING